MRRTTVLLDEELAREVGVFAAVRGLDKTAIMHAALRAWLAAQSR